MTLLSRLNLVTLLMFTLNGHSSETTSTGVVSTLADNNSAFAMDLYARLKNTGGNLFFSPYSISTCLAMTYAGAHGNTASEMAQTLHFNTNQSQVAVSFRQLQQKLNSEQDNQAFELNLADGLWTQKDHPLLETYLEVAHEQFGANLQQANFRTDAEATRLEINNWVSDKTKTKIINLIPPGLLGPMTRLVLVNAIYFKGRWASEFKKEETSQSLFSITASNKVEVSLMHLTTNFKYARVEGFQMLELPYVGDDLAMIVLLPDETNDLVSLEGKLNMTSLGRWLAVGRKQKVEVFLPKFQLTAQFSLARTLSEMGMADAFTSLADFSGMDGERDLYISAVMHKAFVEVNEEGTEAAAATAVIVRSMAVMRPWPMPVFRADHPFIFLIRDAHSGSILFLGRMVDPTRQ